MFRFLIMTFNLRFYHQLWVKWVCIHIGNSSGHIGKIIHDSQNICGCLTLDEMHIELASLITFLIDYILTNTSSTPPPEVTKTELCIVNLILSSEKKFTFIRSPRIKSLTCFKHPINVIVVLLFCESFFQY